MRALIGLTLACGIAAPATAETVCVHFDDYCSNNLSFCHYAETSKSVFLAWRPGSLRLKPIPPADQLPPRPSRITSCEAVKKEPPQGYCEATLCGPTNLSSRKDEVPYRDLSTTPAKGISAVPKPRGAIQPGLIEGDAALSGQGPTPSGNATSSSGMR